jgi:hypothetical protein
MRGLRRNGSWCFVCQAIQPGREQGITVWSYSRGAAMRWGICWPCWRLLWAALNGARKAQA